jgi:Cof subfamily protein (haloacid dehalogenase superfamily)
MKNIRACFFDLDGTLLRTDHTISPAVIRAVRRLEEEGVAPVIATGRSYEALLPAKETLGIHSPVICYNGSMIVNGRDSSVMSEHILPEEEARRIIDIARREDYFILAYRKGKLLYEKERPEAAAYRNRIGIPGKVVNFDSFEELNLTKCLFIADHEKLKPVLAEIENLYGSDVNAFFSDPLFLEVVNKGVDKGRAVTEVMALLGGTVDQAMAMGDGYNDLPMLQAARWGVVMENGLPDLKALFPPERTAGHCDDDGAARYLADYFGWTDFSFGE